MRNFARPKTSLADLQNEKVSIHVLWDDHRRNGSGDWRRIHDDRASLIDVEPDRRIELYRIETNLGLYGQNWPGFIELDVQAW